MLITHNELYSLVDFIMKEKADLDKDKLEEGVYPYTPAYQVNGVYEAVKERFNLVKKREGNHDFLVTETPVSMMEELIEKLQNGWIIYYEPIRQNVYLVKPKSSKVDNSITMSQFSQLLKDNSIENTFTKKDEKNILNTIEVYEWWP